MNNHVIYLENNEIRAKSILSKVDFESFMETLPEESILFKDGVISIDSLADEQKETFHLFFKSMKKTWDIAQILIAPKPSIYKINEDGIDLTVKDMPLQKKRGRKKKETK